MRKHIFRPLAIGALLAIATESGNAAYTLSASGTVLQPSAYTEYGGGDMLFRLGPTTGISGCDGFWLRPSDAGFYTNLTLVLYALKNQNQVRIYADPAVKWNGTSTPYCWVYSIQFQ